MGGVEGVSIWSGVVVFVCVCAVRAFVVLCLCGLCVCGVVWTLLRWEALRR